MQPRLPLTTTTLPIFFRTTTYFFINHFRSLIYNDDDRERGWEGSEGVRLLPYRKKKRKEREVGAAREDCGTVRRNGGLAADEIVPRCARLRCRPSRGGGGEDGGARRAPMSRRSIKVGGRTEGLRRRRPPRRASTPGCPPARSPAHNVLPPVHLRASSTRSRRNRIPAAARARNYAAERRASVRGKEQSRGPPAGFRLTSSG